MAPIRPFLREAGLTEQQWRVLRVLVDEGDSDPSGLAQAGLLYPPTVTRILKELADRGLLVRHPHAKDGRRSLITVTPAGRNLVEITARHTSALLDEYGARFGVERMQALQAELVELAELIGPLSGGDGGSGD
jgi:homoprotocatechuate degradation regulator HpaR